MATHSIRPDPVSRPFSGFATLATSAQLEAIEAAALGILDGVGLAVDNPRLIEKLAAAGFRADAAGRHRVPRAASKRFLADLRRVNGNAFTVDPPPAEAPSSRITLDASWYALYYLDPDCRNPEPFTIARHAETLHLIEALRGQGLRSTWVAQAADVPGPLRPLMQYWVAGRCLADPLLDNLLQSPVSLPYELAMAEALDRPIRDGNVHVCSPLRLAGESVDCVVQAGDHFQALHVGSMPTAGSTASIRPGEALALAAAETIGAAILLEAALGLPARFGIGVHPASMRTLMIAFGSPEQYLLQVLAAQVDAFFHGCGWRPWCGDLHVGACLPDIQAAVEKTAVFAAGANWGTRHFTGAGVLGTDEIFSPEQLLLDLEIRSHFERIAAGWDVECDPERALAEVQEALENRSFAALDSTAALHRQAYWSPEFFFRGSLANWRASGMKEPRLALRDRLHALRAAPRHRPSADRIREIDRILAEAQAKLGTNYTPPEITKEHSR